MLKSIIELLLKIEQENKVKIIYAVESGSRGWGFSSKDSDYDVRFIYVHPLKHYLSVFEQKDFIQLPVDEVLDVNGWDLKKALKLMYKSNPPLLEWFTSPIVYREEKETIDKLRNISEQFFSPVAALYHYINLAKKTYEDIADKKQIKIKKIFYVLRTVMSCRWIERYYTMPPMLFNNIIKTIGIEDNIMKSIEILQERKKESCEGDLTERDEMLLMYLGEKIEYFEEYANSIKWDKNRNSALLDEYFIQTVKGYGQEIL